MNHEPSAVIRRPSAVGQPAANVAIRPQHPDDANDLHNLWRHPLVARTTLQIPSLEYAEAAKRLEKRPENGHRLAAEVDGRVVGACGLFVDQFPRSKHCAGLGMMVHPDYWGQGIGSQLLEAALDLADNWLNITRVELEVNTDNPAAIHLYEKFGFEIEGTKRFQTIGAGRWAHTHFMARIRE